MKYFTVSALSLALLSKYASATLQIMAEQLNEAYAVATNTTDGPDRTFGVFIEAYLAAVDQYGCWCYFNADSQKGKGPVVNTVDSYCKTLSLGYECAIFDGRAISEPCEEPWFKTYVPSNLLLDDPVVDQCTASNAGDNCATWSCIIEGHFTLVIFEDLLDSVVYDPQYKHFGGFFFPGPDCAIDGGGSGPSERDCCGNYPFRFPYKTYNDERACCGQKTYNVFNKCCEDENVSLLLSAGNCT